jgi:tripartite-type tricarboxylate transporter receptor subunit TctC
MDRRLRIAALTILALAVAAPWNSLRAQDYPARAVTTVVPFAAGGAGDILSRILSKHLEQRLGKPFVVENKPGGGGTTGAVTVAKSSPDGYTLLMSPSGPIAVNPVLMKEVGYDPVADFMPLALVAGTPFMLVVNPSLPVHSLADLVKYAKEQGKPLPFAMVGPGTPHHLFTEMLKAMTGIEVTYVPYRGSQPAITDVVAGHVPVMFCDLGPAGPQIAAGKVRAIGSSTMTRLAAFPNVPSLHEAGAKGFDAASWQMMVAPAKTPKPVVDKLNAELNAILALPDVKEAIAKNGMVPMPDRSVEGLQDFVKTEIARWGKVVRDAGIAGTQ